MRKVTLLISEDTFAFAERMAEEDLFYEPEDYLYAVLNSALLREMDEQDWPKEPQEDEVGSIRLKAHPDEHPDFDDLNDGIPF